MSFFKQANPGAEGVWFGNTAWPSGRSPGVFARDVYRIEGCQTDRERALAIDKWLLRCFNRGANLQLPGLGAYLTGFDPLTLFTSWGHNECTGWGWVAAEMLNATGVKTRRAVAFNSGHTFYEVWYKGLDGREAWHAFDPFAGWYFLNERGEVASCEELAANPDLVAHPRPGGRARLGHNEHASGVLHRYQVHDLLDVVQPVRGEELSFHPVVGQRYTVLWRPENPALAIPTGNAAGGGARCSITLYDEEGKPTYPEHYPYWRNYVWPGPSDDTLDRGAGGRDGVRHHGCGKLLWQPMLYGDSVTAYHAHAVFEHGTIRPSGPKRHCEVWWRIRLPYLCSYLHVNMAADRGGGDLIGLAVSPDQGRSVHTLFWGPQAPPKVLTLKPGDSPSLRGLKEFWIRMDLSTQSSQSPLRMRGLQFHVGYQVNMNILPRLVPGANELYLEAQRMEGVRLEAEWAYTHPEGERVARVELGQTGRACSALDPGIRQPQDLIMRGVALRCLPQR